MWGVVDGDHEATLLRLSRQGHPRWRRQAEVEEVLRFKAHDLPGNRLTAALGAIYAVVRRVRNDEVVLAQLYRKPSADHRVKSFQ